LREKTRENRGKIEEPSKKKEEENRGKTEQTE